MTCSFGMAVSKSNTTDTQALLTEQSQLVARLSEITALLSSGHLPTPPKAGATKKPTPPDIDRKAYAIGLIWRNPNISTRDLAKKVGVSKSTLFLPSWKDVGAVLRARKNMCLGDHKDHHTDEEYDE